MKIKRSGIGEFKQINKQAIINNNTNNTTNKTINKTKTKKLQESVY